MTPITGATLIPLGPTGTANAGTSSGFASMLAGVLGQAEGLEQQAEMQVTQLADGTGDIAKAMLTLQEASLAVGVLAQVRDRVVSAYQSLMAEAV